MVLLITPLNFTSITQVKEFARQNKDKLLLELASINYITQSNEIQKFIDFYTCLESVVDDVIEGNEAAKDYIRNIHDRMFELKEEAEQGKEIVDGGILYILYTEFLMQFELLINMMALIYSTLAKKDNKNFEKESECNRESTFGFQPSTTKENKSGNIFDASDEMETWEVIAEGTADSNMICYTSDQNSEFKMSETTKGNPGMIPDDRDGSSTSSGKDKFCTTEKSGEDSVDYDYSGDDITALIDTSEIPSNSNKGSNTKCFLETETNENSTNLENYTIVNMGIDSTKIQQPTVIGDEIDLQAMAESLLRETVSTTATKEALPDENESMNPHIQYSKNDAYGSVRRKSDPHDSTIAPQDTTDVPFSASGHDQREHLRNWSDSRSQFDIEMYASDTGKLERQSRQIIQVGRSTNFDSEHTLFPDEVISEKQNSRHKVGMNTLTENPKAISEDVLKCISHYLSSSQEGFTHLQNSNALKNLKLSDSLTETEISQILNQISRSPVKAISPEDVRRRVYGSADEISDIKNVPSEGGQKSDAAIHPLSSELVKLPGASRSQNEDIKGEESFLTKSSDLRTLEETLKAFGLFPRFQQLEKSLEDVRRHKITPLQHELECKNFDKEMRKLCTKYHPDSVMKDRGSKEEVERAHKFQTALNATRTVLKTLNKMFLEDFDIDHKYGFFTKLDIGLLGNEDEVKNHVYEVLFKISLISEIKQEGIVAQIRKFLTAAKRCVECFIEGSSENSQTFKSEKVNDFLQQRNSALFCLMRCIKGYEKLIAEFEDVEEECRSEKLHNISPLIRKMKRDCSEQKKHLQQLFDRSKFSIKHYKIYIPRGKSVDEYFVSPFVNYVNVILTCSIITFTDIEERKTPSLGWGLNFLCGKRVDTSETQDEADDNMISLLYYLASYYSGNKDFKGKLRNILKMTDLSKMVIKREFHAILQWVFGDLKERFKIDAYVENTTKKYIAKELEICMEMKSEFEKNKQEIISGIQEMKKNNEDMKKRLDKLLEDYGQVRREISDCAAETKRFKEEIENYSNKKKQRL